MGIFDKFKKTTKKPVEKRKKEKPVKEKQIKKESDELRLKDDGAGKAVAGEGKKKVEKKKEDTKNAYKILIRPVITEKATELSSVGKYVFEVSQSANKIEVAKAIENVYGVKPQDINIINMRGKSIRYGRTSGKTKYWKKAIVTLKPGEQIQLYEGV